MKALSHAQRRMPLLLRPILSMAQAKELIFKRQGEIQILQQSKRAESDNEEPPKKGRKPKKKA